MSPLISVCIPTYNAEKYIEKTIFSVLEQSYQAFEIIIVDDASSDNTLGKIRAIADSRIHVYTNQSNLGPTKSWNRLLSLATGDYVKILCHDDILYPESLASHMAVFLRDSTIVLSVSNRDIIDPTGKLLASVNQFKRNEKILGRRLLLDSIKRGRNVLGEPHALLFNKKVIDDNNIVFGANFYLIDLEFYAKILLYGNAFVLMNSLSAFRVSKGSASVIMANNQARQYIQFVQRLANMPEYRLGAGQLYLVSIKAKLWQLLKSLFYFIHL